MQHIIAVDIGGTHIRAAAYAPENNSAIHHQRVPSHATESGVYERLTETIAAVWPKDGPVAAIGLASPGPLDPHTGMILATPNIPEWVNFPLGAKLSAHFGVPVYIDNDANLACFGEWTYGAGRGHSHVLYLTISTGIGGGVVSHDRLIQGFHGLATELGHVTIDPNGPLCSCGRPGHIEAFASGPAIASYVNQQLAAGTRSTLRADEGLTARRVAEEALKGDALAISAFARAGEYLGIAVANFLHIFDPSILIFGGGVTQVGDLLLKPFQESLRKCVFHPRYLEDLVITRAELGDDAGLLGALALARLHHEEEPP